MDIGIDNEDDRRSNIYRDKHWSDFWPDDNQNLSALDKSSAVLLGYSQFETFWRAVVLMGRNVDGKEIYERIECYEQVEHGRFPGSWRKEKGVQRKRMTII